MEDVECDDDDDVDTAEGTIGCAAGIAAVMGYKIAPPTARANRLNPSELSTGVADPYPA